jgi:lipopolysaccharide transport system ATP-binding protein
MNTNDILIKAEHVSKKFCKDLKRSLHYGVQDVAFELVGRKKDRSRLRRDEFWAVHNLSFELKRGECLGLIGPNGSGKTTLLKMLNGLIKPDEGKITVCGRVGALISLGAGFNPVLTGRENVYINASVLGLTKREIDKKFDAIIAFADIGDFIDSPVQNYSSGMQVRLGFAIAAQLQPDVLLIDEILAVGDAGFRARCYDAMYAALQKAAVIFVSHNMFHVNRMCNSVMVMNKGIGAHYVNPGDGISEYFNVTHPLPTKNGMMHSNAQAKIDRVRVTAAEGKDEIYFGQRFEVSFMLWLAPEITSVTVTLNVLSRDQLPVAFTRTKIERSGKSDNWHRVRFVSPQLTLSPEKYSLGISIFNNAHLQQILWYQNIAPFEVQGECFWGCPVTMIGNWETSIL